MIFKSYYRYMYTANVYKLYDTGSCVTHMNTVCIPYAYDTVNPVTWTEYVEQSYSEISNHKNIKGNLLSPKRLTYRKQK